MSSADDFVQPLLREIVPKPPGADLSPIDLAAAFRSAIEREDIRAIQAMGPSLIRELEQSTLSLGIKVVDVVRGSLEVLPNPDVAEALPPKTDTAMPQSWSELLYRLRKGDGAAVERFLALDHSDRPGPERLIPSELDAAVATLEELLTHPATGQAAEDHRHLTEAALAAFVEDFVSEPQFPRPALAQLYLQLLRLWGEYKKGSAYAPDGQLLLVLSVTVLRHVASVEDEVVELLANWWSARPIRSALPFVLEAIEVILELTLVESRAQDLWIDGVTLAARQPDGVVPTERLLWRALGLRAGFTQADMEAYIPTPPSDAEVEAQVDPVERVGLKKIAIVSLHERAADEASAILAERTGATVFVVNETVAGPATSRAQSADVVLFVWAATKHAVFRAFDTVRDRLVYVQGSGAGSIVLALERWAAKRLDGAENRRLYS
jgi:hypothetical protein